MRKAVYAFFAGIRASMTKCSQDLGLTFDNLCYNAVRIWKVNVPFLTNGAFDSESKGRDT